MKPLQAFLVALLLSVATTQAAIFDFNSGFQNGGVIPDGNPTGWSDTRTVSGLGAVITDVNVSIDVSGGFNGDLYAYLSYNGTLVTLLNRVGTGLGDAIQTTWGFSTAGFHNVTLDDTGVGGNIHNVTAPASASYTLNGGTLASFTGNPNGNWTLFFADMAGGNTSSTVLSWGLNVTAVPEPVNVALGLFAGGTLVVHGLRRWRGRSRSCVPGLPLS